MVSLKVQHRIGGLLLATLMAALATIGWPLASRAEGAAAPARAEVRDLHYGLALFEAYQKKYYSALVDVLADTELQHFPRQPQDSQLLLGELYVATGQYAEAEAVLRNLADSRPAAAIHDRTWFSLGKLYYQKQLYAEARQAFGKVGNGLAPALREEFYTLRANLLIRAGLYTQAVTSLELATRAEQSPEYYYARYNLGVAYIKSGEHRKGVDVLRELGRLQSNDTQLKDLRDQANLTLGYLILRRAPVIAGDFLRRVRLDSRFASRALLGLGWAEVERGNYEVALLPLKKLSQTGETDLAVFESMVLIGYILERMRALPQAVQAYQQAIDILQQQLAVLDSSIAAINNSAEFSAQWLPQGGLESVEEDGWTWEAGSLRNTQEAGLLYSLMAQHSFHEGVKNLRDLNGLAQRLTDWQAAIPGYAELAVRRSARLAGRIQQYEPADTLLRVAAIQQRRDRLAGDLQRIVEEQDVYALASASEQALVERLSRVEQAIQALHPSERYRYRERYQLLQGVLHYRIEIARETRLQDLREALRHIDDLLAESRVRELSLKQVIAETPHSQSGLQAKLDGHARNIVALQERTRAAIEDQEQQLQALAGNHLQALRGKLVAYLDKARLSLAFLQDVAVHARVERQDDSGAAR